jgi:hypothetical protein
VGTWILYVYKGAHGLGHHDEFISTEDQSKLSEAAFWQVIISSSLGMALLKISIALNLLRLSPSRWYTWCLWASVRKSFVGRVELLTNEGLTVIGTAFVAAYSFMAAMTFFLFCKPMRAYWDPTIKGAKCYSIHLFITFALINTGVYP